MAETRQSLLDPDWKVMLFDETDEQFPEILFNVFGVAFADLASKLIVIDSSQVPELEYQIAIEAHEIAHSRLRHDSRTLSELDQEKEADWLGHKILTEMNLDTPAQILAERYSNHYYEDISSQNERMILVLKEIEG
jgi:hypothetical protein